MRLEIPMHLPSAANLREHWHARHRRVKFQRTVVALVWRAKRQVDGVDEAADAAEGALPCVVTLTRLAPRELDDDNLAGAFKGVRDQIAAELGIDDRDKRVRWAYAQEKARACAIRIEISGQP